MQFNYSVLSYDGLASNPSYVFTPDGEQPSTNADPQLVKIQIQNLYADQEFIILQHNQIGAGYYPTLNRYVDGAWQSTRLDTDSYISVPNKELIIAQYVTNYNMLYLCESEEQVELIPEYGQRDMIVTRTTKVTTSTFDDYKCLEYRNGNIDHNIPICFLLSKVRSDGTEPSLSYLGLSTQGSKLVFGYISSGATLANTTGASLPINVSVVKTGEVIPDLNGRVIDLENEVASIQTQLEGISSQMDGIQTKLGKILSATSTFFVSR